MNYNIVYDKEITIAYVYTAVFKNDTTIISVLQFSAVTGSQQDTYRCNATSTAGSDYNWTEISLSGKL